MTRQTRCPKGPKNSIRILLWGGGAGGPLWAPRLLGKSSYFQTCFSLISLFLQLALIDYNAVL